MIDDLPLVKRDFILRLHHAKNILIGNIVLIVFITLIYMYGNFGNDIATHLLEEVFGGFSYEDLDDFRAGSFLNIPFYWIIFRLLFILSIGTHFQNDLFHSGGFIIVRTGKESFVKSKVFSLFIYVIFYHLFIMISLLLIILIVSMTGYVENIQVLISSLTMKTFIEVIFPYFIFLMMASSIEGLLFELISIRFHTLVGLLVFMLLLLLSIFTKVIFFVSSYTMFSRWGESNLLDDHRLTIIVWMILLTLFIYLAMKRVVKRDGFSIGKEAE